jgi:hypothetical protein
VNSGIITHKRVIFGMPKVLENPGSGAIQILDFGFKKSCGN